MNRKLDIWDIWQNVDATDVNESERPQLIEFRPANPKCAIIICPGGAYEHLSMEKEGYAVASWLASKNVLAFVLKYRLGKSSSCPLPVRDAVRAVSYVRANAERFGIASLKIGMLGFSAGGHLVSTVAVHWPQFDKENKLLLDGYSSRPDFTALIYPVISMKPPYAHRESARNLMGTDMSDELVEQFSNEIWVNENTPSAFLVHASDDTSVPVEHSLMYYNALRKNRVESQLHIFPSGGHGFGLGQGFREVSMWPLLFEKWCDYQV